MSTHPALKSVMTSSPHCIAVTETLRDGERLMLEHGIHHLPVIDGHRFVGLVTEKELRVGKVLQEHIEDKVTIGDICLFDSYSVSPETPLAEVLEHMGERALDAAVVLDGGEVIGIFTSVDACRMLAAHLRL